MAAEADAERIRLQYRQEALAAVARAREVVPCQCHHLLRGPEKCTVTWRYLGLWLAAWKGRDAPEQLWLPPHGLGPVSRPTSRLSPRLRVHQDARRAAEAEFEGAVRALEAEVTSLRAELEALRGRASSSSDPSPPHRPGVSASSSEDPGDRSGALRKAKAFLSTCFLDMQELLVGVRRRCMQDSCGVGAVVTGDQGSRCQVKVEFDSPRACACHGHGHGRELCHIT